MPFSWSYDNSLNDILSLIWVDNFFQKYDVEMSVLEKMDGQKDGSHDRNINCLMLEPHMGK